MRTSHAPTRQRGASVLELVAVLAALLLLASFAVPAFDGYVERGRTARAVSDIGTMSLKLYRWQRNTHGWPATLAEAAASRQPIRGAGRTCTCA